eukprot:TRINITY_DN5510_c0_g1_i2.p1 TRINITY_DN5510_c0_g1~~TRINITY_DN5510_c0_g1_i2.p1  ORF type:complete len:449 (+),score=45.83 TRINITY_DN5510_c0_g1_i2:634-1980(+)
MLTSEKSAFIFHKMLPLESLRVDDMPDRETQQKVVKNAFKIVSPNKSFVVYVEEVDKKIEWLVALNDAISAWRQKQSTFGTKKNAAPEDGGSLIEAPIWIPDDEVLSCMNCSQPFAWLKRRHHCRACGKVVCNPCSAHRLMLPNVSDKAPVRVCDECFSSVAAEMRGRSQSQPQLPNEDERKGEESHPSNEHDAQTRLPSTRIRPSQLPVQSPEPAAAPSTEPEESDNAPEPSFMESPARRLSTLFGWNSKPASAPAAPASTHVGEQKPSPKSNKNEKAATPRSPYTMPLPRSDNVPHVVVLNNQGKPLPKRGQLPSPRTSNSPNGISTRRTPEFPPPNTNTQRLPPQSQRGLCVTREDLMNQKNNFNHQKKMVIPRLDAKGSARRQPRPVIRRGSRRGTPPTSLTCRGRCERNRSPSPSTVRSPPLRPIKLVSRTANSSRPPPQRGA